MCPINRFGKLCSLLAILNRKSNVLLLLLLDLQENIILHVKLFLKVV